MKYQKGRWILKWWQKRGHGRPNMTWERQVEEHIDMIELKKEDATDRTKWRDCVYELSRNGR